MQLVDRRIYPYGETYNDYAVHEIDHMEFLKTTGYDDAINYIYTGIETAIERQGYTLLTIDISYEEGIFYHTFDISYKYMQIGQTSMQSGTIQQMGLPLIIIELLPLIILIVQGLIAYILINTVTKSVNSIFYSPGGDGDGGPSMLTYVALFIGAAFLLNALTGVSKEVRRY